MPRYIEVEELYEIAKNQAVINASRRPDDDGYVNFCNFLAENTYETALLTPVSDAAPIIHARWIVDEHRLIRCSNCKFVAGSKEDENVPVEDFMDTTHYCYNCGAKMDLEDVKE